MKIIVVRFVFLYNIWGSCGDDWRFLSTATRRPGFK